MALQELMHAVKNEIGSLVDTITGRRTTFKYTREVFIGIALLGILGLSFLTYRWYVTYREQAAQKVFAEYMIAYNQAMQSGSEQDWARAEVLLKLGYDRHARSYIAPYFLAFQAQALIQQGKKQEALAAMNAMVAAASAKSPVFNLFKTKRALMMLDAEDESMQQQGLEELMQLGREAKNIYNDMALFYLGRYYWALDKIDEARTIWQELVDGQWHEQLAPSPWVQEAKQKLNQIV